VLVVLVPRVGVGRFVVVVVGVGGLGVVVGAFGVVPVVRAAGEAPPENDGVEEGAGA
jgi:hypothetical protein